MGTACGDPTCRRTDTLTSTHRLLPFGSRLCSTARRRIILPFVCQLDVDVLQHGFAVLKFHSGHASTRGLAERSLPVGPLRFPCVIVFAIAVIITRVPRMSDATLAAIRACPTRTPTMHGAVVACLPSREPKTLLVSSSFSVALRNLSSIRVWSRSECKFLSPPPSPSRNYERPGCEALAPSNLSYTFRWCTGSLVLPPQEPNLLQT